PDESDLETIFSELCKAAALPEPEKQAVMTDEQGFVGRVDFLFHAGRVVVEIDSTWHDGPLDRRSDAERDERLKRRGWVVIRLRWRDLGLTPEKVVRRLRNALARQNRT